MMAAAPDRATGGCACFWWRRRADTRAAAAGPAADELGWSRARLEQSSSGRKRGRPAVRGAAGDGDGGGSCWRRRPSSPPSPGCSGDMLHHHHQQPVPLHHRLVAGCASSPVARPLATLAAGPGRSARKGELLVELIHGRKSEGGFWAVGGEDETGRLTENWKRRERVGTKHEEEMERQPGSA